MKIEFNGTKPSAETEEKVINEVKSAKSFGPSFIEKMTEKYQVAWGYAQAVVKAEKEERKSSAISKASTAASRISKTQNSDGSSARRFC